MMRTNVTAGTPDDPGDLSEQHLDDLLRGYSGIAGTDVLPRLIAEIKRRRTHQAFVAEQVRHVIGEVANLLASGIVQRLEAVLDPGVRGMRTEGSGPPARPRRTPPIEHSYRVYRDSTLQLAQGPLGRVATLVTDRPIITHASDDAAAARRIGGELRLMAEQVERIAEEIGS